ncbi:MAG: 3-deoxy-D-manno-octulosonic acid transferase [Coxiellaceae bacterium]|nr:3-deoxy-D-manno-octulosonic acid transferase [Coxiellaceae bacterium]
MLFLYTALFYLLLPFVFLRLLWRSRRNSHYRKRWSERLGYVPVQIEQPAIWIHAVSVGEVIASIPLVKSLCSHYPDHRIVMTTTTPTGSDQVLRCLKEYVTHFYLPYDLPSCIHRFIRRRRVEAIIIMETELWPNLLNVHYKKNLPIIIANARLSAKSKRRYNCIKPLVKRLLSQVSVVIGQTDLDIQRYIKLGLQPDRAQVSGNIKFDLTIPQDIFLQASKLRERIGIGGRPTIILSSTHEGEEKIWIPILKSIRKQIPDVLLLVAPRHPDRFDAVRRLLTAHDLVVMRRSLGQVVNQKTDVYLCDTMGELLQFYAVSDISFVGGSLVPVGGHNLIEPAALGLPVMTGQYLQNFDMIKKQLLSECALLIVSDPQSIIENMVALISDQQARKAMGVRAKKVVEANHGALQRHLSIIDTFIEHKDGVAEQSISAHRHP